MNNSGCAPRLMCLPRMEKWTEPRSRSMSSSRRRSPELRRTVLLSSFSRRKTNWWGKSVSMISLSLSPLSSGPHGLVWLISLPSGSPGWENQATGAKCGRTSGPDVGILKKTYNFSFTIRVSRYMFLHCISVKRKRKMLRILRFLKPKDCSWNKTHWMPKSQRSRRSTLTLWTKR